MTVETPDSASTAIADAPTIETKSGLRPSRIAGTTKRSSTTRVTYSLGTGIEYNGNRNAFPREKFNLVGDVPFQATPHNPSGVSNRQ